MTKRKDRWPLKSAFILAYKPQDGHYWCPCYYCDDFTKNEMETLRQVMERQHGYDEYLESSDWYEFEVSSTQDDIVRFLELRVEWRDLCEDRKNHSVAEDAERLLVSASTFADEIRAIRVLPDSVDDDGQDEESDDDIRPPWFLCLDVGHGPLVFDRADCLTWNESLTLIDLLSGPIEKAGGDFTIVLDEDRTENPALYIKTRLAWEEYCKVLAGAPPCKPPVSTRFWKKPPPVILGNIVGPDMRLWAHRLCRQFIDELIGLRQSQESNTGGNEDGELSQPENNALFLPGPLQQEILKALNGKALKKQALADLLCKGEGTRLYRSGGIKELRAMGLVAHKPRIGFYRPDAPPPGAIKSS